MEKVKKNNLLWVIIALVVGLVVGFIINGTFVNKGDAKAILNTYKPLCACSEPGNCGCVDLKTNSIYSCNECKNFYMENLKNSDDYIILKRKDERCNGSGISINGSCADYVQLTINDEQNYVFGNILKYIEKLKTKNNLNPFEESVLKHENTIMASSSGCDGADVDLDDDYYDPGHVGPDGRCRKRTDGLGNIIIT